MKIPAIPHRVEPMRIAASKTIDTPYANASQNIMEIRTKVVVPNAWAIQIVP